MIITRIFPYSGSKALADELNQESARHYNAVLTNHWRTFRKKGVWLSEKDAYRTRGSASFFSVEARLACVARFVLLFLEVSWLIATQ